MDIAAETREFRDAIDAWAKGYAARRHLTFETEPQGATAEHDLRRWSRRRFTDPSAFSIVSVDISS